MKSFNYIKVQTIKLELAEFKDSHAINGVGNIFNYITGEMIFDWIEEMNKDVSYEPRQIDFYVDAELKSKFWKDTQKGIQIKLWEKERKDEFKKRDNLGMPLSEMELELYKTQRKKVLLQIYKTKWVEHLLNKLADNNQFIEI